MRRRYGSQEQAKREIFARYASFIYLGNGRYGFAAASEYYFGKSPVELHAGRRGQRRAPGCDQQGATGLRPRARQPAADDSPQPDSRPDGAQRVHPREPRDALPGRTDPRRPRQPDQDRRSRRDRARPRRTDPAWRESLRRRRPVPGADRGPLDGRRARADDRERRPRARSGPVREAAPQRERADPGLGGRARQRGRGDPGRGGRAAGLRRSRHALLGLQPRHGLAAPAGLRDEAAGVPGRVRVGSGPRHHGARRAHRGAAGRRRRHQVDRQLRQPVQGPDPGAPGPGRVAQRRGRVDHAGDRRGHGDPDRPQDGDPVPAAALPVHGARGVGGAPAGIGGRLSRHRLGRPGGTARHRSRDRRLRRRAVRGAAGRAGDPLRGPALDPGGAPGRGPSPRRHRPQSSTPATFRSR